MSSERNFRVTPKQKTYRLPDNQSGLYELKCDLTHEALLTVTLIHLFEGKEVYRRVFGPVSYYNSPSSLPESTHNETANRLLKHFYQDFLEDCRQ
jgi:hypothetical protein